jgi:hypothetical protein
VKRKRADAGDKLLLPTTRVAQTTADVLDREAIPSDKRAISICVVCCATASMPHTAPQAVATAFAPLATVQTILLSETEETPPNGVEIVVVPRGTKLSKIRRLADLILDSGEILHRPAGRNLNG